MIFVVTTPRETPLHLIDHADHASTTAYRDTNLMNEHELTRRIRSLYVDAEIAVTGEGCSFEVSVTTPAFSGMNSLQRQRSILSLFKEELASNELHALTIKAKTPAETEQVRG